MEVVVFFCMLVALIAIYGYQSYHTGNINKLTLIPVCMFLFIFSFGFLNEALIKTFYKQHQKIEEDFQLDTVMIFEYLIASIGFVLFTIILMAPLLEKKGASKMYSMK